MTMILSVAVVAALGLGLGWLLGLASQWLGVKRRGLLMQFDRALARVQHLDIAP